jgi:hypothetical protein
MTSEISQIMYRIPHDSIPVAHWEITLKDTHLILLQANEVTYDGNRSSLSDDS